MPRLEHGAHREALGRIMRHRPWGGRPQWARDTAAQPLEVGISVSRIYLLGDASLDRAAYRALIRTALDAEIMIDTDFAPTSIWTALRQDPEMTVVIADQARREAVDAVEMISRLRPNTHILIVSHATDPTQIEGWGRCSLTGFLAKSGTPDDLVQAIRAARRGDRYFSDGVRPLLEAAIQTRTDTPRLTPRESELLPLLARGLTLREAAEHMAVSYKTADSYRTNLLRKLGLRDRVQLARYAIRERIIEP